MLPLRQSAKKLGIPIGQQLVDFFPRLQFGQQVAGFFRHQLGDEFRQRVVDELQLFHYKRLYSSYPPHFYTMCTIRFLRNNNSPILFIKFWICHVCLIYRVS